MVRYLRKFEVARGVIFALLVFSLGVLPPLRAGCACATKEPGKPSPCCSPPAERSAASCCCTTGNCGGATTSSTGIAEQGDGCPCAAAPARRIPTQLPVEKSPIRELSVLQVADADWQLPAVIPAPNANYESLSAGPPIAGPSFQIAFCVWRN